MHFSPFFKEFTKLNKFGRDWHFLHVYENETVLAKSGKYATYTLNFIKNLSLPFNITLTSPKNNVQVQPLGSILKKSFSLDVK